MPEFLKTKPKTVCRKCVHNTPSEVYCGAEDVNRGSWSVLTGDYRHLAVRCVDINDGDCPHFKAKAP